MNTEVYMTFAWGDETHEWVKIVDVTDEYEVENDYDAYQNKLKELCVKHGDLRTFTIEIDYYKIEEFFKPLRVDVKPPKVVKL